MPNGNILVATIPSRVRVPIAVRKGVSSVSSGVLVYAVTHILTVFAAFSTSSSLFVAAFATCTIALVIVSRLAVMGISEGVGKVITDKLINADTSFAVIIFIFS